MSLFTLLPEDVVCKIVRITVLSKADGRARRAVQIHSTGGALASAVSELCTTWCESSSRKKDGPASVSMLQFCTREDPVSSQDLATRTGHNVNRLELWFTPLAETMSSLIGKYLPEIRRVTLKTDGYGSQVEGLHEVLDACRKLEDLSVTTKYLSRGLVCTLAANAPKKGTLYLDFHHAYIPRTGLDLTPIIDAVKEKSTRGEVVFPIEVSDYRVRKDLISLSKALRSAQ